MTSRRRLLKRSRLYVILDSGLLPPDRLVAVADDAARGGADILQLRVKDAPFRTARVLAGKVRAVARRHRALFIMNDRLDLALAAGCDGLHIGQGDIDIALAKRFLEKGAIIGVSITNSEQALKAGKDGADYLGVGPIFKTPIKPGSRPKGMRLLDAVKRLAIPIFAIGGIDRGKIALLRDSGFDRVAVIRAVCGARDPYRETKKLKEALIR
jgi:thiamine-phosphate pyrophosphorylase